jgi:hypothetical protein
MQSNQPFSTQQPFAAQQSFTPPQQQQQQQQHPFAPQQQQFTPQQQQLPFAAQPQLQYSALQQQQQYTMQPQQQSSPFSISSAADPFGQNTLAGKLYPLSIFFILISFSPVAPVQSTSLQTTQYASPAQSFGTSSSNPFATFNQPLTPSSSAPFTNYFTQQHPQPPPPQQQQPLNAFSNFQQSQFSQSSFF